MRVEFCFFKIKTKGNNEKNRKKFLKIDKNRKIIVEPKYEDIRISKDDYFVCLKVGKGTDFYDTEGTKILEYSINHFTRKYSFKF